MEKKVQWTIKKGWMEPLGISRNQQGVNFAIEVRKGVCCELILYKKGEKKQAAVLPFSEEFRFGNVLSLFIESFPYKEYEYTYRINGVECLDPYGLSLEGKRRFGKWDSYHNGFFAEEFDWNEDQKPGLALNEVILYCMHLRGYTKHFSSKVEKKGTFLGLIEKIPYLKDFGINQVELMPIYEFVEVISEDQILYPEFQKKTEHPCVNYWGYADENYYFAVKKTYAAGSDERTEFKSLVRELHKNGIELILEFHFKKETRISFIIECLKYWVSEYHIDGFHLTGDWFMVEELLREPLLADVKIYAPSLDMSRITLENKDTDSRRAAVYSIDYLINMRSFLKGDSGKVRDASYFMRRNGDKAGFINYFTCHDGFTMMDMVSYDHKHNEANGEGNQDGWKYNFTWNCGAEGRSRKGITYDRRRQQMKNAWVMLLLSQGIPAILAGDEFCNTQEGNNNAYCQDNAIGWINWKVLTNYKELHELIKQLIRIRKEHPIFHLPGELKMLDEKGIGYPDLSYHSEKAWYIDYRSANHCLGALYCGEYAECQKGTDDYFYIAYNMNWNSQSFALPDLPKNRGWYMLVNTYERISIKEDRPIDKRILKVRPRSIIVLIGKKVQEKPKNGKKAKRT